VEQTFYAPLGLSFKTFCQLKGCRLPGCVLSIGIGASNYN